jgi:biopolymer transport protein TolQ
LTFGAVRKSLGGTTIPEQWLLGAAGPLGDLLAQTGWVARIVLIILLFFSLFSWAIIFQKWRRFSQLESATRKFLEMFRSSEKLPAPKMLGMVGAASPLAAVYAAGFRELESQVVQTNPHGAKVKSLGAVEVRMQLAAAEEVRRLEKYMPWLATTASVSPFIGLFGTVWGVMDAFAGLGQEGAATLRAVAPGMAEALIATAAGLFAAIPALIAYNHFLHRVKDVASRMDNFSAEFRTLVEKHYG